MLRELAGDVRRRWAPLCRTCVLPRDCPYYYEGTRVLLLRSTAAAASLLLASLRST